jgi:dTDP-4-amino-4,6-dideoxygalactose transaminase
MSFADNKVIPTYGTAGAILTDSTETFYNLLHLRKHGKPYRSSPYNHFGLNGIPDEDKAAQVLVSSRYYEKWQARRHKICDYYNKEFAKLGVELRPRHEYNEWNTHKYSVFFENNFEAQKLLKAEGVGSEVQYPDGFSTTGNYPMTDYFKQRALSIPINGHLTDSEVETVVQKVNQVWKKMNTKNS